MEVTSEHLKQLNNLILNPTYTKKDEMVPNGNGIWDKMNGVSGSQFGHLNNYEFWTRILDNLNGLPGLRLIKTILSLLVGSMERAEAFSGDGVRPVHLPPGKEEEGTALPPDEPNRPFPVGSGA